MIFFGSSVESYSVTHSVAAYNCPTNHLIDTMLHGIQTNEYQVGVAIEQIVGSPQFRNVRGEIQ